MKKQITKKLFLTFLLLSMYYSLLGLSFAGKTDDIKDIEYTDKASQHGFKPVIIDGFDYEKWYAITVNGQKKYYYLFDIKENGIETKDATLYTKRIGYKQQVKLQYGQMAYLPLKYSNSNVYDHNPYQITDNSPFITLTEPQYNNLSDMYFKDGNNNYVSTRTFLDTKKPKGMYPLNGFFFNENYNTKNGGDSYFWKYGSFDSIADKTTPTTYEAMNKQKMYFKPPSTVLRKTSYNMGNPRYVMNIYGGAVEFFGFIPDVLSGDVDDGYSYDKPYSKDPVNVNAGLKVSKTVINDEFYKRIVYGLKQLNFSATNYTTDRAKTISEMKSGISKMTPQQYSKFLQYVFDTGSNSSPYQWAVFLKVENLRLHLIGMKASYDKDYKGTSFEQVLDKQRKALISSGEIPSYAANDTKLDEFIDFYTMFRYFEISSIGTQTSYGHMTSKYVGNVGTYLQGWHAPKLNRDYKNIRIASEEYPIGKYNSVEVYKVGSDGKLGPKLDPKKDVLAIGDIVEVVYRYGFEGRKVSVDGKGKEGKATLLNSKWSPIFTDLGLGFNGDVNNYTLYSGNPSSQDTSQQWDLTSIKSNPDQTNLEWLGIAIGNLKGNLNLFLDYLTKFANREKGILKGAALTFDQNSKYTLAEFGGGAINENNIIENRIRLKVGSPKIDRSSGKPVFFKEKDSSGKDTMYYIMEATSPKKTPITSIAFQPFLSLKAGYYIGNPRTQQPRPGDDVDNMLGADDDAWTQFFKVVPQKGKNVWVAFSKDKLNIREKILNNDRIKIDRKLQNGTYMEITSNGDLLLGDKVGQGEFTKLRLFVQRAEVTDLPEAQQNPVKLSQLYLKLNEMSNDAIGKIDDDNGIVANGKVMRNLYKQDKYATGYPVPKDGNPNLSAKIIAYTPLKGSRVDVSNNQGALASVSFSPGMSIEYEVMYKVPTQDEIAKADTSSRFDKARYDKKPFQSLGLMFSQEYQGATTAELNSININKTDDWAKIILPIKEVVGGNMTLSKVTVFDESGTIVAEQTRQFQSEDPVNKSVYRMESLDPKKNYYIQVDTIYTNPPDKLSVNNDLKTNIGFSYNGLPLNIDDAKYQTRSTIPGKWKHNQIGTYKYQTFNSPSISTYDPAKMTNNPLIIPIKYQSGMSSLQVSVKIPETYNSNDNLIRTDWERSDFSFKFAGGKNNNAVTNIQLFDLSSGKEYNTLNSDGMTYMVDPNKVYKAVITVTRLSGSDPKFYLTNPRLEATYRVKDGANPNISYLYPTSSNKNLNTEGQVVQYTIPSLYPSNGFIEIKAVHPYDDDNLDDNTMSKTWLGMMNIFVSDFQVSPNQVYAPKEGQPGKTSINFSAAIGYTMTGGGKANGFENDLLPQVPIEIRDSNGSVVYSKLHDLSNGSPIYISGSFYNGAQQSLYESRTFVIVANGTWNLKSTSGGTKTYNHSFRKYRESKPSGDAYDDNGRSAIVAMTPGQSKPLSCKTPLLRNDWTVTYDLFEKTGDLRTIRVCDETCNKNGCRTKCWTEDKCFNVKTRSWKETWDYYEKLTPEVLFRSQYTIEKGLGSSGWVNASSSNQAVVRAGQWYEFYVKTTFSSNRQNMPQTYYDDKCNYMRRSPGGAYPQTGTPDYLSIQKSGNDGYGDESIVATPYSVTGGTFNNTKLWRLPLRPDSKGITTTRRYISPNQKSTTINITLTSSQVIGMYGDTKHPKKPLQICTTGRIYIKDQLSIKTQGVSN